MVEGRLFYFAEKIFRNKQASTESMLINSSTTLNVSNNDVIMMRHCRLSQPNFDYLKRLFPNLFFNKNLNYLSHGICQLAKPTHLSYPMKPYK